MYKELTQSIQGRDETIQGTTLCSYTYKWVAMPMKYRRGIWRHRYNWWFVLYL